MPFCQFCRCPQGHVRQSDKYRLSVFVELRVTIGEGNPSFADNERKSSLTNKLFGFGLRVKELWFTQVWSSVSHALHDMECFSSLLFILPPNLM